LLKLIKVYQRSCLLFLRSKRSGHYDFSYKDMKLFIHEHFWKTPEITQISRIGGLVQLQIDDVRIFWPAIFKQSELPWLYNEIFYDRTKNPSSYNHPKAIVPEDGWVIDAGAHEGFFCHFAYLKGADKVIAIEPIYDLRDALYKSFEKEKSESRFFVETMGLGKEPGVMNLNYDPEHPCEASLDHGSGSNAVEIMTVDEIIARHNLSHEGFIKMDIEGSEMDALMGAQNTLKTLKPKLAIAVYHEYENARKCAEIIKDIRSDYQIEFRGMNGYYDDKPRPYLLFAW
jgi:FkbM family methyltransferase